MVTKGTGLMALNLTLAVIIMLPLAILLWILWKEVSQPNDREGSSRTPAEDSP